MSQRKAKTIVLEAPSEREIPTLAPRAAEAAKAIRVGEATLYGLIDKGELKCIRVGRNISIPISELQAFLTRSLGKTSAPNGTLTAA